jgi:hypothetical protein
MNLFDRFLKLFLSPHAGFYFDIEAARKAGLTKAAKALVRPGGFSNLTF